MAKENKLSYEQELSNEVFKLFDEYEKKFGEKPPIFGYSDEELLVKLEEAIEKNIELEGAEEGLYKTLGIKKDSDKTAII